MTTSSGELLEWFKSSALSLLLSCIILFILLPPVYLDMLGFRLTCPVGYGHVPSHPVLGCDKWYQSQAISVSRVQAKSK